MEESFQQWLLKRKEEGRSGKEILCAVGLPFNLEEEEKSWLILNMIARERWPWQVIAKLAQLNHFTARKKLPHLNTFEEVVDLFRKSEKIIVLTGAGVSVSCGIPDFRSAGGVYEKIEEKYPELADPQLLFSLSYFQENPKPFFEFAKEIFPGKFKPSLTHRFIRLLQDQNKLLRNYTQNIDTLEKQAGIERLVECHGSFGTATCLTCKNKVEAEAIKEEVMKGRIPVCTSCSHSIKHFQDPNDLIDLIESGTSTPEESPLMGVLKPDIVFFGERLPESYEKCIEKDLKEVDLLLVIGSSLEVKPVSLLPSLVERSIPQILVNKEIVGQPHEFDVVFLCECDNFVFQLCERLGLKIPEDTS